MPYLKQENLPDGWIVVGKLHVCLEKDKPEQGGECFIASDNVESVEFWGMGDTAREALFDYGLTLTEVYELYEKDIYDGDEYASGRLDTLRRYIRRV